MLVVDLDVPAGRLTDQAERVINAAMAIAHRRGHSELTNGHLFLAYMQVEWDRFVGLVEGLGVNPQAVLFATEGRLSRMPSREGAEVTVSNATRLVARLALERSVRAGRGAIAPSDLLSALLEETHGLAVVVLRGQHIDVDGMLARLTAPAGGRGGVDEVVIRRLELPPSLKQFGVNLNLLARLDRLPPVFGREPEIDQILEVLSHRDRSSSVMLLGEAGVGKTAVVEALARRLELDPESVPIRLRDAQIVSLPMNALVAGTMLRGMFEDRLQHVIQEVKERPNLILFVDEAHTLMGAGSALGAPSDAANILKSALARGDVRIIAATTAGEYKEHIQEDEALARRFRCVHVPEPSIEETRRILRHIRPRLERNYAITVLDEAIDAAIEMAPRYMRHLHLPDKAIGWLDGAAVRAEVKGRPTVTRDDVTAVISEDAQIPKDMVCRDITDRFSDIESRIARRIVGQREAIRAVAQRLVLNKGPLKDGFDRPDGVLLFLGPTGVGKTELAKALAEVLFGDEKKMVRLDMSEYQDPMTAVDKLIGMPRGIVGSQRGGTFTNQLKDNPNTVILLDEVEKAASQVLNLFLQAFDEGWVTDGRGRRVYLSDSIVIMTSNIGSQHYRKVNSPLGFLSQGASLGQVRADIRRELERSFSPELLNRIDEVVFFAPLTAGEIRQIAKQYLAQIAATLAADGKRLDVDDDALDLIATQGYSPELGARPLKRFIDTHVKLPITLQWHTTSAFRVCASGGSVQVEVPAERFVPHRVA